MSNYFGLHEVYGFLRKLGMTLILPKLIVLETLVLQKPTSCGDLIEISKPRSLVPIVILS